MTRMNGKDMSCPVTKSDNMQPETVRYRIRSDSPKNFLLDAENSHHYAVRKFAEFENSTIQKQRQEMQLLIVELRSRDKELNEMVADHRKQLLAWEQDRNRMAASEEKCDRYERELLARNEEIHGLKATIHARESEDNNRQLAMQNMQDQLNSITEQYYRASHRLKESQEINRSLLCSIHELKSTVAQNEQKEHELFQLLSSKDRALSESAGLLAESKAKLKRCELQLQDSLQTVSNLRKQVAELQKNCEELKRELDCAKKQSLSIEELAANQHLEMQQYRQKLLAAQSEITIAGEREQRKNELLQLSKSRQERTEAELAAMRDLCDTQQRDISMLNSNLDAAKNLLSCKNEDTVERNIQSTSYSQISLPTKLAASSSSCSSPVIPLLKVSRSANSWKESDISKSDEDICQMLPNSSSLQTTSLLVKHNFDKSLNNLCFSSIDMDRRSEAVSVKDQIENYLVNGHDESSPVGRLSLNPTKNSRNTSPLEFTTLEENGFDDQKDNHHLSQPECTCFTKISQFSGPEFCSTTTTETSSGLHKLCDKESNRNSPRQPDVVGNARSLDGEVSSVDDVIKDQVTSACDNISPNETSAKEGNSEIATQNTIRHADKHEFNFESSGCITGKSHGQRLLLKLDSKTKESRFDNDRISAASQKWSKSSLDSTNKQMKEKKDSNEQLKKVYFGDTQSAENASCRQSSLSSLSQYSVQSEPSKPSCLGNSSGAKASSSPFRAFHWSGSYEQLSETVRKDWARSCNWKSAIGEKVDGGHDSSYNFPSIVAEDSSGHGGHGGHGDGVRIELRVGSGRGAISSTESDMNSLLQKYSADIFNLDQIHEH